MHSPPVNARDRRSTLAAGIVLALAALAAYHNSFSAPFLLDDRWTIIENPSIRRLGSFDVLRPHPSLTTGGRPLVNATLAVNYALGGLSVQGYRAVNLLIHICAGLVLFGTARRTLLQPSVRGRLAGAATPLAFCIALLWTVHPLQTAAVTYVVQRAESLVSLFYLLTLYCFIRGAGLQGPPDSAPSPGLRGRGFFHPRPPTSSLVWYALAAAACLLGAASKEAIASAPLIVFLYDRAFVAGSFREAWRRRGPAYLGLFASWALLAYLFLSTGNRAGTAGFGAGGIAWWAYGLTQCEAILRYLGLVVWPQESVFDYGTDVAGGLREVAWQAAALAALLAFTALCVWRWPKIGFACVAFFAILAPSSSIVPVATQTMAEHRMYLALGAVLALFAAGLHAALGWRAPRTVVLCLVLALGLGWLTVRRNETYADTLSLWDDTAAKRPDNSRAHSHLGDAYYERGRFAEAAEHYRIALRLKPDYPRYHVNLANALTQLGQTQEAIEHFRAALRGAPDFSPAHTGLGIALTREGRLPEAISAYEKALENPEDEADHHLALFNLGAALFQLGRILEAIEPYEKALLIRPDDVECLFNLGLARFVQGRPEKAVEHYRAALRIDPACVPVLLGCGNALAAMGRLQEAVAEYEKAIAIAPDNAAVRVALGLVLVNLGRPADAIEHYEKALRIDPNRAAARNNLAMTLERLGRLGEAEAHYAEALRLNPANAAARERLDDLRRRLAPKGE